MVIGRWFVSLLILSAGLGACSWAAQVKYYGEVPLEKLDCKEITAAQSSFVRLICYDKPQQFMVIQLRDTKYPYCEIDEATVKELLNAPSIGTYYNQNLKGSPNFDCRVKRKPVYP